MLSYRHAFHAGNHADVLKHIVFIQLLRYLAQKDKAFWVIDTHAGAGVYALDSSYATKLSEFDGGIGRLWSRTDLPPAVEAYVDEVRALNPNGALQTYPGSPWLALRALREQDRLRLFELHSSDIEILANNFKHAGRQVMVTLGDGFAGLKGLLPPPPRRALTLIDPSYEMREDYAVVLDSLTDSLRRFPIGTYAVWYPQLAKPESRQLPHQLKNLGVDDWLHVSLSVRTPSPDGFGLHGSGIFIINPPWTLAATLQEVMPWLTKVLAEDPGASYKLEHASK
ncbi:MAG TPA: 23S rRNA (adenine(2030)-N(6))-methyltransferase RlmJ [Rhodocyclaceae bacterium]|nr:23S rRNA (adenine(2030)-N(6))-methyltransferase RlmJ [Rhodocyclaceae bacterium]